MPSPAAAAGGSSSRGNNSHGSASVASASSVASVVAAAALSSTSRDVFQGLFLDLGKQAMAMETVLRLICGKVDSMEAWMTEVAFGMTELDLKLRNIAHNIEGTAADVDGEAANMHRWAAPPSPQDDRAHVTATVKKKLGPHKKGIKVSSMVAAVIDTLSVPADERDNVVFATSSSSSNAVAASTAAVNRPTSAGAATHKKKPSTPSVAKMTHHKKKTQPHKPQSKETVSTTVEDSASEDRAVAGDGNAEKVVVNEQQIAKTTDEAVEHVEEEAHEPPIETKVSVPALAEQMLQDDHEGNHTDHGDMGRSLDSERLMSEANRGGTTDRSVDLEEKPGSEPGREKKSDDPRAGKGERAREIVTEAAPKHEIQEAIAPESTPVTTPEIEQQPLVDDKEDQAAPGELAMSYFSKQPQPVESRPPVLVNTTAEVSKPVAESTQAHVEEQQPQILPVQAPPPISDFPAAAAAEATSKAAEKPKSQPPSQKEIVSGGYLPPPPQEDANRATCFQLSTRKPSVTATATTTIDSPSAASQPQSPSVSSSPEKLTKKRSSKKQQVHAADASTASKPVLVKEKSSRKAMEATIRRASSCRKAQLESRKPKTTETEATAAIDNAMHGQASPSPGGDGSDAAVESHVLAEAPPTAEEQPDNGEEDVYEGSEANDGVNSKGSDDESSSEDDSDSSSSSESDNQNGAEEGSDEIGADSTNANAAVKNAARRLSKMPGPTSKTTHTITALKKLKEANMLTPEEEEELKQRAQGKWFKLKGHIKEKKKDVANILLKRKKNVFTVSARIELLEDKSKEVFASIKQLTNDLKTKMDMSANDILRRQVFDINLSLQALDHKITHGATPAMEKVLQLGKEVELVRSSFSQQLVFVNKDIAATKLKLATAGDEHCNQLEFLSQSFQQQVANLVEEYDAKLRNLPDHSTAIEGVKRMLRRKADVKLLKECVCWHLGWELANYKSDPDLS